MLMQLCLSLLQLLACEVAGDYIANVLELNLIQTKQMIEQLRHTFTIDNPVLWLAVWLCNMKIRLLPIKSRDELLHGLEVVNQPVDTREERRQKIELCAVLACT